MTASDAASLGQAELVFVGLPETGKTTYLALLFRAIVAEKAGTLRLGSYQDDREYVNQIADRLAECSEANRTLVGENQRLELSVASGSSDFFLTIPDVSGETWRDALVTRSWTPALDDQISQATSFAIFVNAGQIDRQPTIAEMRAGMEALGVEPSPETASEPDGESSSGDAECHEDTPTRTRSTQVSVVDLFQLLSSRHKRPVRACLMISAWDLVAEACTPTEWLSENLPLVQQFIETNESWLQVAIWSTSAQGGDFSSADERERLLPLDAVDRSHTVAGDGTASAIERPLKWLLGLEK